MNYWFWNYLIDFVLECYLLIYLRSASKLLPNIIDQLKFLDKYNLKFCVYQITVTAKTLPELKSAYENYALMMLTLKVANLWLWCEI